MTANVLIARLATKSWKGQRLIRIPSLWDRSNPLQRLHRGDTRFPWETSYPEGLAWEQGFPERPIAQLLDDAVASHAKRPCFRYFGVKYTYRDVGRLVDRVAKGLQELGVGKGTKVGLLLPNSPYSLLAYYGVLKAGGTVVNYNPLLAVNQIARQVGDSDTTVMVTLAIRVLYPKVTAVLRQTSLERVVVCRLADILPLPHRYVVGIAKRREIGPIPEDGRHVRFTTLIANDGAVEPVDIRPQEDVAILQYTGGLTGLPKGAMLTHANIYANTLQASKWFPNVVPGRERVVGVLPLFHGFGMTAVLNTGVLFGAELILLAEFKVDTILRAISRRRATFFAGVPTMFAKIANHEHLGRYNLSALKLCISGGAPLSADVKRRFSQRTGRVLVEGYGLTEACAVVTCAPPGGRSKEGSVGLPLPGTIVEILSRAGRRRSLAPGEIGEICVKGPQVMAGYWRRPGETELALRNGRLHTGDVGYMDEDGYVYLTGRIKPLILVGGFNVYPPVVEAAICGHPAVAQAMVCGVADRVLGEKVKALVKIRDDCTLTAAELRSFLRERLAPFEMPRQIEFVNALPQTVTGWSSPREILVHIFGLLKVLRRRVQDDLAA